MSYQCKVVADSIGPSGVRLTTLEVTYPLFVHAEHLRHRSFSFSVASNRAIPTKRILSQVIDNPFVPIWFGRNQGGMSAREELRGWRRWVAHQAWLLARWPAVAFAWALLQLGLHKQIANRILGPWQWVTLLVTGTDWENFFALRCHPDAQPEIRVIAEMMRHEMAESWKRGPKRLMAGEWHLPLVVRGEHGSYLNLQDIASTHYGVDAEDGDMDRFLCMVSAARCARVTMLNHDKKETMLAEVNKADRLFAAGHFSPFEHQAQALPDDRRVANLRGWRSFRSTIPNEANFGRVRDGQ